MNGRSAGLATLLLIAASVCGCSRGRGERPIDASAVDGVGLPIDAGAADGIGPHTDAGTVDGIGLPTDAGVLLCNGDPAVRFAYQAVGGGQSLPGSQVVFENGSLYLLVTGGCHYWTMRDRQSDLREGDLSPAQAAELAHELRLGSWSDLDREYVRPLCDGGDDLFRFDDRQVAIRSRCSAPDTSSSVQWLTQAAGAASQRAYDRGAPVSGPVRFVLVSELGTWSSNVEGRAAPWPLSIDPASIALSYEAATRYEYGSSQIATSGDAAVLRQIRRDFFASGGGPFSGGFIPILGPGGARYQLFVRDSIPLEDDRGLLDVQ
jgi:hypothetical protein